MPAAITITAKYWDFYIEGREDRKLKNDIDPEDLAKKLQRGASLRDAILDACESTAKPLDTGSKVKRVWLEEHADAIAEAGGDSELAFGAWVRGRVEELAYVLEPEVINALWELVGAGLCGSSEEEEDEDEEDEDDD